MRTVKDSLRSVNAYPIPSHTIEEIARKRGLDAAAEASMEILLSSAYRLATADLLRWLSMAPDVTQGGISYSFSDEQRNQFIKIANGVYKDENETIPGGTTVFGYKGTRL